MHELRQPDGERNLRRPRLGVYLRNQGVIPKREILNYLADLVEGKLKDPRGRKKALDHIGRDKLIANLYPTLLSEEKSKRKAMTPGERRAVPKFSRKPPYIIASERVATEAKNAGYGVVNPNCVAKIFSSEKKRRSLVRN